MFLTIRVTQYHNQQGQVNEAMVKTRYLAIFIDLKTPPLLMRWPFAAFINRLIDESTSNFIFGYTNESRKL